MIKRTLLKWSLLVCTSALLLPELMSFQCSSGYPPASGQTYAWPRGTPGANTVIYVWIAPELASRRTAIEQTVASFNNFAGSNVTFQVVTTGPLSMHQQNCMNIYKGNTQDNAWGSNALSLGTQWLRSAEMHIRNDVVEYQSDIYVRKIVAHEIGESFGLGDCQNCGPCGGAYASVMDQPPTEAPSQNTPNFGCTAPFAMRYQHCIGNILFLRCF